MRPLWNKIRGWWVRHGGGGNTNRARDGHPGEGVEKLERKHQDIDPSDLGNGDGICRWHGRVEHSFRTGDDFVECGQAVDCI